MRLLIVASLFGMVLSIGGCQTQSGYDGQGFIIHGELKNLPDGKLILFTYDNDRTEIRLDSTQSGGSSFELSGQVEQPALYYIHIRGLDNPIPLFLENAEYEVSGDATDIPAISIIGGPEQKLFAEYNAKMQMLSDSMSALDQRYSTAAQSGDLAVTEEIEATYMVLIEKQKTFIKEFAAANTDHYISPFIALSNLYYYEYPEVLKLSEAINEAIPDSKYGVELQDQVEVMGRVQIGQTAPDFSLPTTSGDSVRLSDLRGKYLLVDFWASWCGPCRQENPNVVAAFEAYKEKDFDILGVSLDRTKSRWEEAIQADGLNWNHVSDLQGWNSSAAALYGIRSIPFSLLLDKNGVIIERNLRGEDLWAELEKLMGPAS